MVFKSNAKILLLKTLEGIKYMDQSTIRPINIYRRHKLLFFICIAIVGVAFRQNHQFTLLQKPTMFQSALIFLVAGNRKENISAQKGFHQTQDLRAIIRRIQQKTSKNIKLILWGRSMGAVTIIRYLSKFQNERIILVILDSPFINLKGVIMNLVKKKVNIPKMLIELVLKYIEPAIEQKAEFNINSLDLEVDIQKIITPTIFMASKKDNLVPYEQIQLLYQKVKTKKSIYYMDQQHHQQRSNDLLEKIFKSIWKHLLEYNNSSINIGTQRFDRNMSIAKKDQYQNKLNLTLNRACLSIQKKRSFDNSKTIFLRTAHLIKNQTQQSALKQNRKIARISSIKLQSKQLEKKRRGLFIRDLNVDL